MNKIRVASGGVSAAAALAAGSGAYAGIIVVAPPANLPNAASPAPAGPITWDVNGDATNDFLFSFRNNQVAAGSGVIWQAQMNPVVSGGNQAIAGYLGPFVNYGSNLAAGTSIGAALPAGVSWRNAAQVVLGSFYRSGGIPTGYGGFADNGATSSTSVVRGFAGFRFDIGGLVRYGWLDVEVRGAGATAGSGGIYFFGAAYEDSGASIDAGAVPAPGSLAALALGAAACLRRKRRVA